MSAAAAAAIVSGTTGIAAGSAPTNPWHFSGVAGTTTAAAIPQITRGITLVTVNVPGPNRNVNVVGRNPSAPGNYHVFEETLKDRQGQPIGHDYATCLENYTGAMCRGTFHLDGRGDLIVDGTLSRSSSTLAVTGGTGRFSNVRGDVHLTFQRTTTTFTFHLIP